MRMGQPLHLNDLRLRIIRGRKIVQNGRLLRLSDWLLLRRAISLPFPTVRRGFQFLLGSGGTAGCSLDLLPGTGQLVQQRHRDLPV